MGSTTHRVLWLVTAAMFGCGARTGLDSERIVHDNGHLGGDGGVVSSGATAGTPSVGGSPAHAGGGTGGATGGSGGSGGAAGKAGAAGAGGSSGNGGHAGAAGSGGSGVITFAPVVSYKVTSGGPNALADLDSDRDLDIAVANGELGPGSVTVLLNRGDGSLSPGVAYAAAVSNESIVAADVNKDMQVDILTPVFNGGIDVLEGNGQATFVGPVLSPAEYGAWGIALGDFDRDGLLDLVNGNASRSKVALLLGRGDLTFQPEIPIASYPGEAVVVSDFNTDGALDVAYAGFGGGKLEVLLGYGNGKFEMASSYMLGSPSSTAWTGLAVADLDGDGHPDLVANTHLDNAVHVLLSNGDGTFRLSKAYSVGSSPKSVATGDFDNDGQIDVAASTDIGISVLKGAGDGALEAARTLAAPSYRFLSSGDLDRNGKTDLVGSGDSREIGVFLAR